MFCNFHSISFYLSWAGGVLFFIEIFKIIFAYTTETNLVHNLTNCTRNNGRKNISKFESFTLNFENHVPKLAKIVWWSHSGRWWKICWLIFKNITWIYWFSLKTSATRLSYPPPLKSCNVPQKVLEQLQKEAANWRSMLGHHELQKEAANQSFEG